MSLVGRHEVSALRTLMPSYHSLSIILLLLKSEHDKTLKLYNEHGVLFHKCLYYYYYY